MKDISDLRKKVYEATIAKLQGNIIDEEHSVREAQQMANEYGPPKDRYDGFRMQLLRKRDLMAEQLQRSLDDLEAVKRIGVKRENPSVSLGAMVITETQKLFIATGLGKIEADGEKWHVISTSAPIVSIIQGLHKGDTFEFQGKKIRILEVF